MSSKASCNTIRFLTLFLQAYSLKRVWAICMLKKLKCLFVSWIMNKLCWFYLPNFPSHHSKRFLSFSIKTALHIPMHIADLSFPGEFPDSLLFVSKITNSSIWISYHNFLFFQSPCSNTAPGLFFNLEKLSSLMTHLFCCYPSHVFTRFFIQLVFDYSRYQ